MEKELSNEIHIFLSLKYNLPSTTIDKWNTSAILDELPEIVIYNWMWKVSEHKFNIYKNLLNSKEIKAIESAKDYKNNLIPESDLHMYWCATVTSTHFIETFFYYAALNQFEGFIDAIYDHDSGLNHYNPDYEELYNIIIQELYEYELQ